MTPDEIKALRGRYLVPAVATRSNATERYRVVGYSADSVRVQSTSGNRSALAIAELAQALNRGLLLVED
jgi:hypothetical protein